MGCEQEDFWPVCKEPLDNYDAIPIWIDNSCDVEVVDEQIGVFNDFSESMLCEPLIEVVGTIDVDHKSIDVPINTIACYKGEPTWYHGTKMTKFIGYSTHYKNIRLFNFKIASTNQFRSLILHELFHYVGVYGHTDNENDIMFKNVPIRDNYSENDMVHFCSDGEYVCQN